MRERRAEVRLSGRREALVLRGLSVATATAFAMTLAVVPASVSGAAGSDSQRWRISELAAPVGWGGCTPTAINERGQVLGQCSRHGRVHAFLWSTGRAVDVGSVAGKTDTQARALNGRGQVVGYSWAYVDSHYREPQDNRAFVSQRGEMTDLGPGEAEAINDHGEIVGYSTRSLGHYNSGVRRAVLWYRGKRVYLARARDTDSVGIAINERSQVAIENRYAPTVAWLWRAGRRTRLGAVLAVSVNTSGQVLLDDGSLWRNGGRVHARGLDPPDAGWGGGSMNDRGQIVGRGGDTHRDRFHARLWQDGRLTDLGTLPGTSQSEAVAINDIGQIIGQAGNLSNREPMWSHAFVWQNGRMTDLGTLPGDSQSSAAALNDRGQIIGTSTSRNGHARLALWTPETG
jgi:probable HAF family extracellular repeat protein